MKNNLPSVAMPATSFTAEAIHRDHADVPAAPTSSLTQYLDSHDADHVQGPSTKLMGAVSNDPAPTPHGSFYPKHPDRMLPAAAAAYLGVAESTLAVWRSTKRYPLPFIKVGRLIYYSKRALDAFLISRTVNPDQ